VRRVVVLAAVASLGVVAWAIVGGAVGALYAAAAAIALVGLLLPPALKHQRGNNDVGNLALERVPHPVAGGLARALPGLRRRSLVRELEARLAQQQEENRALQEHLRRELEANSALREQLTKELEALRRANEVIAREGSVRDQALVRVEHSLRRHSRERARLESHFEAIEARAGRRPAPTFGARGAVGIQPLDGGSAATPNRPIASQ